MIGRTLESLSTRTSNWAGSTSAFIASVVLVAVWIGTGPIFGFSDRWQLAINTVTSVVTLIMVFVIQRAQNKDAIAVQIKLSELLAIAKGTADQILAVEVLSETELRRIHARYLELARRAGQSASQPDTRSSQEAVP